MSGFVTVHAADNGRKMVINTDKIAWVTGLQPPDAREIPTMTIIVTEAGQLGVRESTDEVEMMIRASRGVSHGPTGGILEFPPKKGQS